MPKSYKNNNSQQKIKIFLAEVKELIKLFVRTPSFKHRTKLVASGIIELNFLAFVGKALRFRARGTGEHQMCLQQGLSAQGADPLDVLTVASFI